MELLLSASICFASRPRRLGAVTLCLETLSVVTHLVTLRDLGRVLTLGELRGGEVVLML